MLTGHIDKLNACTMFEPTLDDPINLERLYLAHCQIPMVGASDSATP